MKYRKTTLAMLIAASMGMLAGCGGGDSPDAELDPSQPAPLPEPEPEPPEVRLFNNGNLDAEPSLAGEISIGSYRYTQTNTSGDEETGIALIGRSGRISFALQDRSSFARVQLGDNGRFNERLLDTESVALNQTRQITGSRDRVNETADTGERITGTVINQETEQLIETYQLERQAADELPLSASAMAATYTATGEAGITTTFTFTSNGTVSGFDSTGCEFEGVFIIPNIVEDIFETRFTAENCGPSVQITGVRRDGVYFGLGRVDLEAQSVQMFTGNEGIAARYSLQDTQTPPPPVAPAGFVNDDFALEQSVIDRLEPGVYAYEDIPLDEEAASDPMAPAPESGVLLISPTGRLGVLTDRRTLVGRIQVNDLDTFTKQVRQADRVDAEIDPSSAASIFGTPDNPMPGNPFQLIGSLLDVDDELVNRYQAVRDDSNDATLTATPLNLTQLAGTFSQTRNPGNITTTFTLATDGTVTGSDTTGCAFNGVANIPDPATAIIEMRLNAGNCTATPLETGDERNGDYNVVGEILLDGSDQLVLILASEQNIDILTLTRQ